VEVTVGAEERWGAAYYSCYCGKVQVQVWGEHSTVGSQPPARPGLQLSCLSHFVSFCR
jgi:hypothetical protein